MLTIRSASNFIHSEKFNAASSFATLTAKHYDPQESADGLSSVRNPSHTRRPSMGIASLNPSYRYRPARGVQNPHARKREIPEPIQADLGCPDIAAKIFRPRARRHPYA